MNLNRYAKPLMFVAIVAAITATGYVFRDLWLPHPNAANNRQPAPSKNDANTPANKIIVGDQAQKNLGLTAKPLQSTIVLENDYGPRHGRGSPRRQ